MSVQVPTLDISRLDSDTERFVHNLGRAYQEYGFCGINGHGIAPSIVDECYRQMSLFFALPEAVKQRYHLPGLGGARGYTGFGVETARDSNHPDLKEFWHVGLELDAPAHYPQLYANSWPSEVPGFKPAMLTLYRALNELGGRVLQALAMYLGLERNYFADKTDYGNSILRPIHYPPLNSTLTESIRSGRHEDINLITLLVGASEPGLQILRPDGSWLPVTTKADTVVVNIGDMLQRLTNHVLPSTTHRVINPAGAAAGRSRYSIPFFLHPNPDFVIRTLPECVSSDNPDRYPLPVTANEYLLERLAEIGLLK
ncbi:isopenicillin N synthase family dioxygenase [Pseudohongiella spirulinae]|uniref:2-oxoglutarate-dependent ethylene/succinate-forming enzyme n=1 Tax=Pseudohongiella spirulinae TaxID=1249552 RepID=A0A0S2KA56_9GAMM|nr:2-oxoglutarate and iron-dependent oxygenase domain-containing protein [Pseudohongiella spirulinae]ALO44974.1 Oxidoreductase [Pseudohongiella spirulinae]